MKGCLCYSCHLINLNNWVQLLSFNLTAIQVQMLESEREILEQQIRETFELSYKQRLNTMKNVYQTQKLTLLKTLEDSYKKVLDDPMLKTLVNDRISSNYTEDRIKQLFQQIVSNEREFVIEKLGLKCSQLSFKCKQLEEKYKSLVNKIKHDEESIKNRLQNSHLQSVEHSQCLRQKEKEIYELKLQIQQKCTQIKHKQEQERALLGKMQELNSQKQYFESQFHKQQTKFQLNNVDLQDSQRKMNLLEGQLQEIEKAAEDKVMILEQKYRKKVQQYKNKIEQYKAKIMQLLQERKEGNNSMNNSHQVKELERKLMATNKENQRKLYEVQSVKEKQKYALQRKYEAKYKQLQNYYEKLLDEKIMEAQRNAEEAVEKIKSEEQQIKKYVEFVQQNSIPNEEYTKLNKYYENIVHGHNKQQKQLEQYIEQLHTENDKLKVGFQKLKYEFDALQSAKNELQLSYKESFNKQKSIEQYLGAYKAIEERLTNVLAENQQITAHKQQQINELKELIKNLEGNLGALQKSLKQQEHNMALLQEHSDSISKKSAKQSKEIISLTEENQELNDKYCSMKKQISEKQHKLSTIKQEYEFKIEEIIFGSDKKQKIIKELNTKLKGYEQNIQLTEQQNSKTLKEKATLEASLKKTQMQNQYLKENEENMRLQYNGFISEYKKKIEEKDQWINQLETKLATSQKNSSERSSYYENRNIKLEKSCRKLAKFLYQECTILHRVLNEIKMAVTGLKNSINDQLQHFEHSLSYKFEQYSGKWMVHHRQENKRLKDNYQKQMSQQVEQSRIKLENLQNTYLQRIQSDKKNTEELLISKDKQIERVEKEKRKFISQKQELMEGLRSQQKKVQDAALLVQNEKIVGKNKLSDIIRQFDEEKERIIRDYDQKRIRKDQELDNVAKALKKLNGEYTALKEKVSAQQNQHDRTNKAITDHNKQLEIQINKKQMKLDHISEKLKETQAKVKNLQAQLKTETTKCQELVGHRMEMQVKNREMSAEIQINKNKLERFIEENQELTRQLNCKSQEIQFLRSTKSKVELQYSELKSALNKTVKNQDLRALQHLDQQTKSLSSKVDELKKVSYMMDFRTQKTPLRS